MTDPLNIDAGAYHADQTGDPRPSLSASIAHTLITSSPLHAWTQHPKLNPDFRRDDDERFDIGTTVHALLLQGEDIARVVYTNDWRTKEAKELRDQARADGKIPLLEKDWQRVQDMVAAARQQLTAYQPVPFTDGKPEQTLVWEEHGVLCRARVDWLRDDRTAIDDFKSTKASANPEQWCRSTLYSIGADIQVEMYLRGARAVLGVEPEWRYVVAETFPPYALSVVTLGEDVLTLARKKVDYALAVWRRCLERNEWPGYPTRVAWAGLPPWEEQRWLEREIREQVA